VPQIIAGLLGGIVVEQFTTIGENNNLPNLGYQVLFGLSIVSFAFGSIFVSKIRGVN
jgi:hypothetical protein